MDIFLDLGFTLMGGTEASPPQKICEILEMGDEESEMLYDITFCENHHTADSLMVSLEKRLGCPINQTQQGEIKAFWQRQHDNVYELEGASDLIRHLAHMGFNLHIISNLWFPFYQKFRTIFQEVLNLIRTETLSFEEGVRKPGSAIYEIALKRAGAVPGSSLMLGDSLRNDIIPCAKLGMKCVWFKSRPMEQEKLEFKRLVLSEVLGERRDNVSEADSLDEARSLIKNPGFFGKGNF